MFTTKPVESKKKETVTVRVVRAFHVIHKALNEDNERVIVRREVAQPGEVRTLDKELAYDVVGSRKALIVGTEAEQYFAQTGIPDLPLPGVAKIKVAAGDEKYKVAAS